MKKTIILATILSSLLTLAMAEKIEIGNDAANAWIPKVVRDRDRVKDKGYYSAIEEQDKIIKTKGKSSINKFHYQERRVEVNKLKGDRLEVYNTYSCNPSNNIEYFYTSLQNKYIFDKKQNKIIKELQVFNEGPNYLLFSPQKKYIHTFEANVNDKNAIYNKDGKLLMHGDLGNYELFYNSDESVIVIVTGAGNFNNQNLPRKIAAFTEDGELLFEKVIQGAITYSEWKVPNKIFSFFSYDLKKLFLYNLEERNMYELSNFTNPSYISSKSGKLIIKYISLGFSTYELSNKKLNLLSNADLKDIEDKYICFAIGNNEDKIYFLRRMISRYDDYKEQEAEVYKTTGKYNYILGIYSKELKLIKELVVEFVQPLPQDVVKIELSSDDKKIHILLEGKVIKEIENPSAN